MRVLVCGSREWKDLQKIQARLSQLPSDSVVIHGDCRGADRMAGDVAEALGFRVERYPADWVKLGKKAGPMRNTRMIEEGKPELGIAFHEDFHHSTGTADCVRKMEAKGIPVEVIS